MAFVGLVQMLRSGGAAARRGLELTIVFGALLCTVGAFHVWWGGEASAGRPVASDILLFGIPIASLFASAEGRPSARAGFHVLLATSLAIAVTLCVQGGASSTTIATAAPSFSIGVAHLAAVVGISASCPGPFRRDRTNSCVARAGSACRVDGAPARMREFGRAAVATLALGFAGAVALVSVANTATTLPGPITPEGRARAPLLDRFDAERRPTTVLYNPLSRIASSDALSLVSLVARPGLRTARSRSTSCGTRASPCRPVNIASG